MVRLGPVLSEKSSIWCSSGLAAHRKGFAFLSYFCRVIIIGRAGPVLFSLNTADAVTCLSSALVHYLMQIDIKKKKNRDKALVLAKSFQSICLAKSVTALARRFL